MVYIYCSSIKSTISASNLFDVFVEAFVTVCVLCTWSPKGYIYNYIYTWLHYTARRAQGAMLQSQQNPQIILVKNRGKFVHTKPLPCGISCVSFRPFFEWYVVSFHCRAGGQVIVIVVTEPSSSEYTQGKGRRRAWARGVVSYYSVYCLVVLRVTYRDRRDLRTRRAFVLGWNEFGTALCWKASWKKTYHNSSQRTIRTRDK